MDAIEMARQMLGSGSAELPESLVDLLRRADALCRRVDGRLISRQVVAMIIAQWEYDNPISAQGVDRGVGG
jgi:hypothetical protein